MSNKDDNVYGFKNNGSRVTVYSKDEIDNLIGDINSILDEVNGEEV